jgi:hypothetical protein
MKKFIRILVTGLFLTGLMASFICLRYSSRITAGACHNKAQTASRDDDSCLSHCLKQKISAVNIENKLTAGLENQGALVINGPAMANLQDIVFRPEINGTYYINQLIAKLNLSQAHLTPLFNHSPPTHL